MKARLFILLSLTVVMALLSVSGVQPTVAVQARAADPAVPILVPVQDGNNTHWLADDALQETTSEQPDTEAPDVRKWRHVNTKTFSMSSTLPVPESQVGGNLRLSTIGGGDASRIGPVVESPVPSRPVDLGIYNMPSGLGESVNPRRFSATDVCGTIITDTTWTLADSPYVVTCDVSVASGATLTIEPEVVVKFEYVTGDKYNSDNRSIQVNGVLHAQGTAGQPIVFTSIRDDYYAGDTNGDGYATSPAPGDWGYIRFNAAGSTFEYCIVRYGGIGRYSGYTTADKYMLWVNQVVPSMTIAHNNLDHSYETAIYYQASSTYDSTLSVVDNTITDSTYGIHTVGNNMAMVTINITDNSLSQNTYPVVQENSFPIYSGNTFNPDNTNLGIGVKGTINTTGIWSDVQGEGLPYVLIGDVTIASGATLTIEPEVVVKFEYVTGDKYNSDNRSIQVNGVLHAQGTAGQPIVFTSIRDDYYAGDTNGDGYATSPAPGDWGYIRFNAAGSTFEYCIVRYGGIGRYSGYTTADKYMLWINGTPMALRYDLLEYSYGDALYINRGDGTPDVTVEYSAFRNNSVGVRVEGP